MSSNNKINIENSVNTKDKCVMCDKETIYKKNSSVNVRVGYIEGCGQLCNKCDLILARSHMDHLLRNSFLY